MNERESPPANKILSVQVFNAKELGESLREVAVDIIRSENQNIVSRWFHSPKDADVFLWRDERANIIKQQVTFFGQLVEWNVVEGIRTEFLIEDESSQRVNPSSLIQYDCQPQKQALEQGMEIIDNIPDLESVEKKQILDNFLKSPHFANLSDQQIMQKFGAYLHQRKSISRKKELEKYWSKLVKRFGFFGKKK